MAYGRRCAVAGPTVQRTGSRSFPIASASSVSRAVVVVHHAKRCSDTGIPRGIPREVLPVRRIGPPYRPRKDALTPESRNSRKDALTPEFRLHGIPLTPDCRGRGPTRDVPGMRRREEAKAAREAGRIRG